jgi:thiamine-monophosphate kinase
MLFTVDTVVAGVHADPALVAAADFGFKAMVASLSDIAAMGGRPCHAVAAVAGPPDTDLVGIARGVKEAALAYGCPLVGGNLSGAGELSIAVAMTGEVADGPPPVLRHGASAGDALCATGALGASAAGLRLLRAGASSPTALVDAHRRPRPHLVEGEAARMAGARAMIDVSDGLAADLARLADASGVGFRLDYLPVAEGATHEEALGGGEDYVLVVVVKDPRSLAAAFAVRGLAPPLLLGHCVADRAERTLHGDTIGGGWEHDFGS